MKNELIARLASLAAQRQTISYGALAAELQIPGPGAIAKLTAALESLMQQDAAAGQPLRAALVTARLTPHMPAAGFFLKAQELGLFDGADAAVFVRDQREKLWVLSNS